MFAGLDPACVWYAWSLVTYVTRCDVAICVDCDCRVSSVWFSDLRDLSVLRLPRGKNMAFTFFESFPRTYGIHTASLVTYNKASPRNARRRYHVFLLDFSFFFSRVSCFPYVSCVVPVVIFVRYSMHVMPSTKNVTEQYWCINNNDNTRNWCINRNNTRNDSYIFNV